MGPVKGNVSLAEVETQENKGGKALSRVSSSASSFVASSSSFLAATSLS